MLTFDIETCPQLEYVDTNGEIVTDAGDDDGQPIVSATGRPPSLHPTTLHIVAASFGGISQNAVRKIEVKTLRDYGDSDDYAKLVEHERKLVETCLDRVAWALNEKPPLVTFNGKGFDLWVLMVRAMILGLEPKDVTRRKIHWGSALYPFRDNPHLDLRLLLGNSDRRARGTLAWWSQAFDIESQESGGEVWDWVRAGKWEQLAVYGTKEAHNLLDLYERVAPWLS